ncbi:MAG TPA: hypothetical protein VL282_18170 [Tepidisphaeraceae bacterium]|jgi:hypothetical protein|nr:hypothetical protein [Tepidisphaeraceae bacterium]
MKSAFMKSSRGFAIYSGLPHAAVIRQLRAEALTLFKQSRHQETWKVEPDPIDDVDLGTDRAHQPRRRKRNVGGGPAQIAMYHDPRLLRFLSAETGVRLIESGERGSYAYYARAGDFIGLHRDTSYCDLVAITVLLDNSDQADPSGALVLYPDRIGETLSSISATPKRGAEMYKLSPGQTLIMFGGVVPHRVIPTRNGQLRVISALCYRAVMPGRTK